MNGIPACRTRSAHTSFHTLLPLAVLLMCQEREPATVPHPLNCSPGGVSFTVWFQCTGTLWFVYTHNTCCAWCVYTVCVFLKKNIPYLLCLCTCIAKCLTNRVYVFALQRRPHYLRPIKLGALFIVARREKARESESPAC